MIIEVLEMLFSNLYFIFYFVTITGFSKVRIHRHSDNNDCSLQMPGGGSGKEPAFRCRKCKRYGFSPWVGKIPRRREWLPTPLFLPEEFQGEKSLVGYSTWGRKEL